MKVFKIIFAILPLIFAAACGGGSVPDVPDVVDTTQKSSVDTTAPVPETAAPETETEPAVESAATVVHKEGFAFVYNGETIYMGDYIDGVVERLGSFLEYIESESCTSEGMMKTYYYGGAEISAYAKAEGDRYRIFSIILTDDSVSTAEGVCIGQRESDMTSAYGTDYQSVPGVCKYTKNGTGLTFDLEGEEIICITYTLLEI